MLPSIALYSIIHLCRFRKCIHGLIYLFIAFYVSFNFTIRVSFYRDWLKQKAIIYKLKQNAIVKSHSTFLISDEYNSLNAQKRTYRFFELSGFFKKLLGIPLGLLHLQQILFSNHILIDTYIFFIRKNGSLLPQATLLK